MKCKNCTHHIDDHGLVIKHGTAPFELKCNKCKCKDFDTDGIDYSQAENNRRGWLRKYRKGDLV